MVNSVEIAEIPLVGRGFVHRPTGNYQPGEFKRLVNMELTDNGTLRKRFPVEVGTSAKKFGSARFIGYLQDYAVMWDGTGDKQTFVRRNIQETQGSTEITVWDTEDLYGGFAGIDPTVDGHRLVGFFRYNNRNHWVSQSYDYSGGVFTHKFWLHQFTAGTADDIATDPISFQNDIPSVHTLLFTVVTKDNPTNFRFRRFFVKKERLWIVTTEGVWFSKATDPSVFAVPDGGFFKFPDDLVKDAIFHQDQIFVMGNDNLSCIRYNTDPNTDASVTIPAVGLGGDALAVHEDSVYVLRKDQLFLVDAARATKVLDLDLGIESAQDVRVQAVSFHDYLVISFYYRDSTFAEVTQFPALGEAGKTGGGYTTGPLATGSFFLNMKNGSLHEFVYHDNIEEFSGTDYDDLGYPFNFFVVPFETSDTVSEYYMYFQTCTNNDYKWGRVYSMKASTKDTMVSDRAYDFAWSTDDQPHWQNIPTLIEIASFTPDGSEMFIKKFRSIVMEGQFPPKLPNNKSMQISIAYDNQAFSEPLDIFSAPGYNLDVNNRFPVPVRFPMNQRARAVSIKFQEPLYNVDGVANPYNSSATESPARFELIKFGLFWTPTGRGPIDRSGT